MVILDRERRRCQGREAPAGLGLDSVGVDDTLRRAKSGEQCCRQPSQAADRVAYPFLNGPESLLDRCHG